MSHFSCLSVVQAESLFAQNPDVQLVDTRDEASFQAGHVQGALSLAQLGISALLDELDTDKPIAVMCYHGISSQQVAAYLAQVGCTEVYSIDGGYETWKLNHPVVRGND